MRALCIALGLVASTALVCDEIGHCQECASTKGNVLGNCRWCPVDGQCHTPGAVDYNPCKSAENIVTPDKCPAALPPQTSFDKEEAVDMTKYSRAAYAETAEIEGCTAISKTFLESSFTCLKSVTYQINYANRNFTVLSYYGYDSLANRIVWSFRGSVNTQYLWEALVTVLEDPLPFPPAPAAMINPFFMVGAAGLTKVLGSDFAWLQALIAKYPSAEVFLTGHSLGGAMAAIVATELALKKIVTPVLYTFGQPRTGDGTFAKLVIGNLPRAFRIVNANDPVPHVPFCKTTCTNCNYGSKCDSSYGCCSLTGTYVHHSTELWFPEGEYNNGVMCGYKECLGTPVGEDSSCSNRYVLSEIFDLAAHSAYWNALSGYCKVAPLGAQPSYTTVEPVPQNSIPIVLIGACALVVLVLLAGALMWARTRAAHNKITHVDGVHLLESFSAE